VSEYSSLGTGIPASVVVFGRWLLIPSLLTLYATANATLAQALPAYPADSKVAPGCVAPVLSHARAVTLNSSGSASTVSDHNRHAHRPDAGSRLACRQVRPP
jgi:hypothetical protein